MNVNLMSRQGFGYMGASLTSLIYASNFIMYCAFEGMILVSAVHAFFPVNSTMAFNYRIRINRHPTKLVWNQTTG